MAKWKKGESGNSKGRALESEQKKRIAADLLSPHVDKAIERITLSLKSPDSADHQWAVNLVMSYVFGKPGQVVEIGAKGDSPMTAVLMIGTKPDAD
jgi:hypothetical protein